MGIINFTFLFSESERGFLWAYCMYYCNQQSGFHNTDELKRIIYCIKRGKETVNMILESELLDNS